jgi:hypothetical protein
MTRLALIYPPIPEYCPISTTASPETALGGSWQLRLSPRLPVRWRLAASGPPVHSYTGQVVGHGAMGPAALNLLITTSTTLIGCLRSHTARAGACSSSIDEPETAAACIGISDLPISEKQNTPQSPSLCAETHAGRSLALLIPPCYILPPPFRAAHNSGSKRFHLGTMGRCFFFLSLSFYPLIYGVLRAWLNARFGGELEATVTSTE